MLEPGAAAARHTSQSNEALRRNVPPETGVRIITARSDAGDREEHRERLDVVTDLLLDLTRVVELYL